MKLLRVGTKGNERPAILDKNGKIRELSSQIKDLSPDNLNFETILKLKECSLSEIKNVFSMKINQENKIFTIANYIDNKDIDSNLLSCISGQNLSIKGWFTEAIATPARDKKIGIFARFFEIFN